MSLLYARVDSKMTKQVALIRNVDELLKSEKFMKRHASKVAISDVCFFLQRRCLLQIYRPSRMTGVGKGSLEHGLLQITSGHTVTAIGPRTAANEFKMQQPNLSCTLA
jgi:hypothetical protein